MGARSYVRFTAVASLFALGGCYVYTPVQTPAPGAEVRVVVPVRSAAQGRGPEGSAVIDGTVLSAGETLVVETRNRQQAGFMQDMLLVDTLRMARADLLSVEERSFSRGRTVVFTVALLAGTALVVSGIQSVVGGSDGGEPGGGDTAQRVGPGPDLFKLRIPLGGR